VIGSSDFESSVGWSGAPRANPIITSRTIELTGGISVMGWATGQATMTMRPTVVLPTAQVSPDLDVYRCLCQASGDYCFLYDTSTLTCWYLPKASVVLQIIHDQLAEGYYTLVDGKNQEISRDRLFAPLDPNGGAEAAKILERHLPVRVKKSEFDQHGKFIDVVREVYHKLGKVEAELDTAVKQIMATKQPVKVGTWDPDSVYGVDYLSVVKMENSSILELMIKQSWVHVTREQPTVLFCKNLRQPVAPNSLSRVCKSWIGVPKSFNYLVTPCRGVHSLHERHDFPGAGARLVDPVKWTIRPPLIQIHHPKDKNPIFHTQQLTSVTKVSPHKDALGMVEKSIDGCLVFGGNSDKPCLDSDMSHLKSQVGSGPHQIFPRDY